MKIPAALLCLHLAFTPGLEASAQVDDSGKAAFLAAVSALQEVDPATAVPLLQQAAEAGHAGAMVQLGLLHRQGYGVGKSDPLATSWFVRAASRGDTGIVNDLQRMIDEDSDDDGQWAALRTELSSARIRLATPEASTTNAAGPRPAVTPPPLATPVSRSTTTVSEHRATLSIEVAGSEPVWLERSAEALEADVAAALASGDVQTAYLQARVWRSKAAESAAAALAMTNVYLDLGAPAAALQTLHEALRLMPSPETRRNLLSMKAQAHAETGEFAAAWSNARNLLSEFTDSDDPVLHVVRQAQWTYFASLMATKAMADFDARLASPSQLSDSPSGNATGSNPASSKHNAPQRHLEARLAAGNATLSDFDPVIAAEAMTPFFWERRLAVAESAGNWPDSVWSATMARRDNPTALAEWAERHLAAAEASIVRANAAADEGRPHDAIALLLPALERDPGNDRGWTALLNSALATEDEALALVALRERWILDSSVDVAAGPNLALAARHGRWDLLVAMADFRVLTDDADDEAHHYRQLAATALGLRALAEDSTPALVGTLYESHARILQSVARGIHQMDTDAYRDRATGLGEVLRRIGEEEPDGARLCVALALQFSGKPILNASALWPALAEGADPGTIGHLDFIRGRTTSEVHRAAQTGDRDRAIALFLERYIVSLTNPTTEAHARLSSVSDDQDLPLLLRAAANALVSSTAPHAPLPLRASDRHHLAESTTDWAAVQAALRPGQQMMAGGEATAAPWSGAALVRLAGYGLHRPSLAPPDSPGVGSLWEVRGFQVTAKATWNLADDTLLFLEDMILQDQRFEGGASLWIEDSDIRRTHVAVPRMLITDSIWNNAEFRIARHLEAARSVGGDSIYQLGSPAGLNSAPGLAAFVDCTDYLDRWYVEEPFEPGLHLHLKDSTFFSTRLPDFSRTASIEARGSAYITPRQDSVVALPTGISHHFLAARDTPGASPATFPFVSSVAELESALSKAKPGDSIRLVAGEYRLTHTLELPDGVTLRGPPLVFGRNNQVLQQGQAVLYVDGNRPPNPLVRLRNGNATLEGVKLEDRGGGQVTNAGHTFRTINANTAQIGVLTEGTARLRLSRVGFAGWAGYSVHSHQARADVMASGQSLVILRESAPGLTQVRDNSRAILLFHGNLGTTGSAQGTGEVFVALGDRGLFRLHGEHLRAQGRAQSGFDLRYEDGALAPRGRLWRDRARERLAILIPEVAPVLARDLARSPNLESRASVLRRFASRLSPLVAAARPDAAELGVALHVALTPVLVRYPAEVGPLLEAFYLGRGLPVQALVTHLDRLPSSVKDGARAYLSAAAASYRVAATPEAREKSRTFMRAFPPGHISHTRALEAVARGQSLEAFKSEIAAERRAAEARAAAARAQIAANEARQKQIEAFWEQQRREQAALQLHLSRQAPVANSSGTYGFKMPEYRVAPSYRPSEAQQMRDFRNELNARSRAISTPRHVPRVGGYY